MYMSSDSVPPQEPSSSASTSNSDIVGDQSTSSPPPSPAKDVNGHVADDDVDPLVRLENMNLTLDARRTLPAAPQLSFNKFLTMQGKRVTVTIRYSERAGLRPYFLTVAKKLKSTHPDVVIERKVLGDVEADDNDGVCADPTFEILVDDKIVVGKSRPRKEKVARVDLSHARSVFVSMKELDSAISRARRRRRPTTVYGEDEPHVRMRLASLRKNGGDVASTSAQTSSTTGADPGE